MKKEIIVIFLISIIWIACSELYELKNKTNNNLDIHNKSEIIIEENLDNYYIPEIMPYTEKYKDIKPDKMPVKPKDKEYKIIPL